MQQTVSNTSLLKAFLGAAVMAVIVLVTAILPAEYNIDPTGIGHKLGLTVLAQSKEAVSAENTALKSQDEHQVTVTVPAGRGIEYKFQMQAFQKMTYEWSSAQALYFDLHGEPQGDTTGYFESYAIATLSEMKGSFTAPFAGSHGWYWKNTSAQAVDVQLKVSGEFTVIGLK